MENIISTLDHVPVGFRFRPTDEELVSYYLKHKLLGDDFPVHVIPEIDLCRVEPWDVPAKSVIKSDDPEWFFFSSVDYKYSKSTRVNRTTKHGFWKSTGNDRNIRTRGTNNVIGTKKTLVFHEGRVPRGAKTNWVIHEYRALTSHESQNTLVLCRLMKKADKRKEGGIEAPNFLDEISLPEFTLEEILKAAELFPPVEQYDDDDEFVNSIFVDNEEVIINEERRHCFVNSSTQPKSLRRVYNASSDTDAEVVSNLVKVNCPKSK
ncbi:unnamed protein product [Sphenostylis stenocarpa]|uniref:NAC domain-containing protein n=1 Tax=Sphenostylis stenocarpa TaxID=92480 RepID=A0AA86VGB8_9FABA|nr:unnamed protein product [Sphenostylis stenocarpa]